MNFIAASLSSVFKTKDSVLRETPEELSGHVRSDLLDLTQTELTEEQTATLVSVFYVIYSYNPIFHLLLLLLLLLLLNISNFFVITFCFYMILLNRLNLFENV